MKWAIFEEHSSSCVVYSRFSGTLFPVSMIDGEYGIHFAWTLSKYYPKLTTAARSFIQMIPFLAIDAGLCFKYMYNMNYVIL